MKKEILSWLKYDRNFNTGILLYFKYGRNRVLTQKLNMQGNTKANLEELLEEFRKMAELSIVEFNKLMSKPVKVVSSKTATPKIEEKKGPALEVKKKVVPESHAKSVEPTAAKQNVKLRDEFPFLNDPACPSELKVLVSDKITAHYNYLEGRKDLFTAKTNKEQLAAAKKTVESFLENKMIYQELDHYKKHIQILGRHKLFERVKRLEEFNNMRTEDLCELRDNISHSIWRNDKLIKDGKNPKLNQSRTEKIENYSWEFAEIEKIIDVRK